MSLVESKTFRIRSESLGGEASMTFSPRQHDMCDEESESVRVYVRVRPFNKMEMEENNKGGTERLRSVVWPTGDGRVALLDPKSAPTPYAEIDAMTFDDAFWSVPEIQQPNKKQAFADQGYVYKVAGAPILANAFEGYNSCIFAYGQTGSGKTYSMMGYGNEKGIIPQLTFELFDRIQRDQVTFPNRKYEVEITFFEIYNEKVKDLFGKQVAEEHRGLKVRNHPIDGPFVEGLESKAVTSAAECLKWIEKGGLNRTTKQTGMNDTSSRSHAIFKMKVVQKEIEYDPDGNSVPLDRRSQLNLVDLAGSERIKKSLTTGDKLVEATHINQSLTTLRKVIDALIDIGKGKKAIPPYRESMLTWVLSESLGGNSKTVMLAAVSPHYHNIEETLSTLRYALRAKSIVNKVRANESKSSKLLREMKQNMEKMQALVNSGELGSENADLLRQKMKDEINDSVLRIRELVQRQQSAKEAHVAMMQQHEKIKEDRQKEAKKKVAATVQQEEAAKDLKMEQQRAFATAFRNAYQLKITKKKYEAELVVYKGKEEALKKQVQANEEKAQISRQRREDLRASIARLRKEIKQNEPLLPQVSEQVKELNVRCKEYESEFNILKQKLQQQNEESVETIARLESSVKRAIRERDATADAVSKSQAKLRRTRQNQDMELLSLNSKYEIQIQELALHVESMKEQDTKMSRSVEEVTETIRKYESQLQELTAGLHAHECELVNTYAEARHRKIVDQRHHRDILMEIQIERDAHKEMAEEGRALLEKVRRMEDTMIQFQKFTLYRAGESAVRAFLLAQGLDDHTAAFHHHGLTDLSQLTNVDDPLLVRMKIPRGHRRKFLAAARQLAEQLRVSPSMASSPPLSMAERLASLSKWYDEFFFAVRGSSRSEPHVVVTTPSPSPGRREAQRDALFGQTQGEDGLWHSPKAAAPKREESVRGTQNVQGNLLTMVNLEPAEAKVVVPMTLPSPVQPQQQNVPYEVIMQYNPAPKS